MDAACEVNEKGTREKNDGYEVVEEGTSTPLDLDPNEVIEADDETLPYAEEDWQDPEQREVPKNFEPDLPLTIQTQQNDRTRPGKRYNPYESSGQDRPKEDSGRSIGSRRNNCHRTLT